MPAEHQFFQIDLDNGRSHIPIRKDLMKSHFGSDSSFPKECSLPIHDILLQIVEEELVVLDMEAFLRKSRDQLFDIFRFHVRDLQDPSPRFYVAAAMVGYLLLRISKEVVHT